MSDKKRITFLETNKETICCYSAECGLIENIYNTKTRAHISRYNTVRCRMYYINKYDWTTYTALATQQQQVSTVYDLHLDYTKVFLLSKNILNISIYESLY